MSTGPDDPVLPEQSTDDTDTGGGDWREDEHVGAESESSPTDAWLERERPPHWE